MRRRILFQLYGHLFLKPFNEPSEQRFFPNGSEAGPGGLGGRVGVEVPPFGRCLASLIHGIKCGTANVALGYAPYPRFVWFELGVTYPVYRSVAPQGSPTCSQLSASFSSPTCS